MPAENQDSAAALFEALFSQAPMGLYLLDTDLRVMRFNPAAAGVRGVPEEAVLGHRPEDFAPTLNGTEFESLAQEVRSTGKPVKNRLVRSKTAAPGRPSVVSVSLFPLRTGTEQFLALAAVVEDVSEREAALDRLDVLHEGHRVIGSTLDPGRTAQELADVTVPAFADAVVIDVLDALWQGSDLPRGAAPADTPMRRAGFRSILMPEGELGPQALRTLPFPTPMTLSLRGCADRRL